MNRFFISLLFALLIFNGSIAAQKTYFVYLQTDNQQPFYVTLNGKNISSASIGYLILPKLFDSTYTVKIGFPGTNVVHEFNIDINGNDQGYMIKDFGEKGWGLFNLQSLAVEMSQNESNKIKADKARQKIESEKRASDSLTAVATQLAESQKADSLAAISAAEEKLKADSISLALESNRELSETGKNAKADTIKIADTGISEQVVSKERVMQANSLKGNNMDTATAIERQALVDSVFIEKKVEKVDAVIPEKIPSTADTTVAAESKKTEVIPTTTSGGPKFLDMELSSDTNTLIPVRKPAKADTLPSSTRKTGSIVKTEVDTPHVANGTKKPSAGITSNNSNTVIVTVPVSNNNAGTVTPVINSSNTNCRQVASEKDFFNLRKKMVSTTDAPEMVLIAKKAFKEKCFTSAQVRNLCVLFLDDPARYNFLDQVYDYTYDRENYKQLSDLLKDEYYIRRFNAMLK
ncbi:MAG: DUF4476 domain-containing protein [Bacteroidota bacterium]